MLQKWLGMVCLLGPLGAWAQPADADSARRETSLGEVVVTGTLRPVFKAESPVAVDVVTPAFWQRNRGPSLFESLALLPGVQAQLTCNVCYVSELRINGLEGPYTQVLVDGMPLVSALGSVYGLTGIPTGIIQQVEVVRGPASTLYGSEAMAGTVNIITLSPQGAPRLSIDAWRTGLSESAADVALRLGRGRSQALLSGSYYGSTQRWDQNADGFTDLPLIQRSSLFAKWQLQRPGNQPLQLAVRHLYEDRFGGQLAWTRADRGTDRTYGESIYTTRTELLGLYRLPLGLPANQRLDLQLSLADHQQNSRYGTTAYDAHQLIGFAQLVYGRSLPRQDWLLGASLRYTRLDDNTPATAQPDRVWLPGLFAQHEYRLTDAHTLLTGLRLDHHPVHGSIASPRLNYRWEVAPGRTLRLGAGNGFRVVSLFTEDHAALTGARRVVIAEALRPERAWNIHAGWTQGIILGSGFLNVDASAFRTQFTNRILPDYDTNPDEIRYANLDGQAISQGLNLNLQAGFAFPLRLQSSITYQDVWWRQNGRRQAQYYAPAWSGTLQASYTFHKPALTWDLTGNWVGAMPLPVLPNDPRPATSPLYALLNLQGTWKASHRLAIYAAVQNLTEFRPVSPLLRPHDPFDQRVNDPADNPLGLSFDTAYNYAPLVGRRWLLGIRYHLE